MAVSWQSVASHIAATNSHAGNKQGRLVRPCCIWIRDRGWSERFVEDEGRSKRAIGVACKARDLARLQIAELTIEVGGHITSASIQHQQRTACGMGALFHCLHQRTTDTFASRRLQYHQFFHFGPVATVGLATERELNRSYYLLLLKGQPQLSVTSRQIRFNSLPVAGRFLRGQRR